MIPNEGCALMLRLLCEQPMLLCLFTVGPARDATFSSAEDFTPSKVTQMFGLVLRDWAIDEENLSAKADKRVFKFSAVGEKVAGWYLMTKKDRVVVGYDYFPEAHQIHSTEDTVGVRPFIRLKAAT